MTGVEQAGVVRANQPSPVKRFIGIVAIYLLVGPPVGGIVFWIAAATAEISRERATLPAAFGLFFVIIAFSYPVGGPLVFVSGHIDAVAAIWFRQTSILVPLVAGCLLAALGSAVIFWSSLNVYSNFWLEFGSGLKWLLPAALIAALVCWRLTRRLARTA